MRGAWFPCVRGAVKAGLPWQASAHARPVAVEALGLEVGKHNPESGRSALMPRSRRNAQEYIPVACMSSKPSRTA